MCCTRKKKSSKQAANQNQAANIKPVQTNKHTNKQNFPKYKYTHKHARTHARTHTHAHTCVRARITPLHFTYPLSLADHWGTKNDRATTFLYPDLFSAFRGLHPNLNLSIPLRCLPISFFSLPFLLPPCTVPCRIIFASPVDLVMCPYDLSLCFSFFHSGEKIFIGPNGLPDSAPHFLICNMPKSLRKHLISVACIFLSNSAVRVHDSQANRKIEMTKECISLILELSAMFLSFHIVLSFVNAPIVWTIRDSISCFDPSSVTTVPNYLKL